MKHKVKQIHFVGIGCAGMSGIAEVLLNLGFKISGSDIADNAATKRLMKMGAKVFHGHAANHIEKSDVVVTSTAVKPDNPEVMAAREKNIPVVPRALMLAELMRFKQGIAVAGTHGKTTTTAMAVWLFAQLKTPASYSVGAKTSFADMGRYEPESKWFIYEADEFDRNFLSRIGSLKFYVCEIFVGSSWRIHRLCLV